MKKILLLLLLSGCVKESTLPTNNGCIIGDSTIATYSCGLQVRDWMLNSCDTANGDFCNSLAVAGHTILQQQAIYLADTKKEKYKYIIVEIGLNDVQPAESANTAMLRYQKLIDTINATNTTAKIIVSKMIPCKQRLINVYGPTNGLVSYNKWLAMNSAIMNTVTGVDYRISRHCDLLNDGSGNLASVYDCGDRIHENNAGRKIIAGEFRKALNVLGLLTCTYTNTK